MKKRIFAALCLTMILASAIFTVTSAEKKKKNCGFGNHPGVEYIKEKSDGDCGTKGYIIGPCTECEVQNAKVFTGYGDHKWQYNGCGNPMKCAVGGHRDAKGPVVYHDWTEATCTSMGFCNRKGCNDRKPVNPNNHNYTGGNCTTKSKCSRCGDANGPFNNNVHNFVGGNCTTKSHCSRCSKPGSLNPNVHNFVGGNCKTKSHCSRCNKPGSISPNVHSVNTKTGKCTRCGKQVTTPKK